MAEMVVSVGVDKTSGGDFDNVMNMFDQAFDVEVIHSPGACAACRANNNPAMVPFPGCEGKKKAERGARIEAQKAKKQGRRAKPKVVTGCRCKVGLKHSS